MEHDDGPHEARAGNPKLGVGSYEFSDVPWRGLSKDTFLGAPELVEIEGYRRDPCRTCHQEYWRRPCPILPDDPPWVAPYLARCACGTWECMNHIGPHRRICHADRALQRRKT